MLIVFRVDSSSLIGAGHLIRCRNLAEELYSYFINDVRIVFLCRPYLGNCAHLLENFELYGLYHGTIEPVRGNFSSWLGNSALEDAEECLNVLSYLDKMVDLFIVDHYGVNLEWEDTIRPHVEKLLIIDDYENRVHHADFIINHAIPSFQQQHQEQQEKSEPEEKNKPINLLGPQYALINRLFFQKRNSIESTEKFIKRQINRIQISFGGSDPLFETEKVLQTLMKHSKFPFFQVDLVLGFNRLLQSESCIPSNVTIYNGISQEEMVELLSCTDLCIGGGGVSLYERSCLGVPSLVITIADNQLMNTLEMQKMGGIHFLGKSGDWSEASFFEAFELVEQNLEKMSRQSLTILPTNSYQNIFRALFV